MTEILSPPSKLRALQERHCGMSYGYLAKPGHYASKEAKSDVVRMADHGIRWIALHISIVQDAFYSTTMRRDPAWTVADDELREFIAFARGKGMRIMFKPMINLMDSVWQGRIHFPDGGQQIQGIECSYWPDWFASFRAVLSHYAQLCEETGVELFCAGCELAGTVHRDGDWRKTIAAIRSAYSGPVTFDTDHSILARNVSWFADLDMLSVSFYCPAAKKPGASEDEMALFLEPKRDQLRELAVALGKPIIFGETGCRSRLGAATLPNDYQLDGAYSGSEQANFLGAICRVFSPEPWWKGMYWWKWDENQYRPHYHTDPGGEMGFTLEGKPAACVLRDWYQKFQ